MRLLIILFFIASQLCGQNTKTKTIGSVDEEITGSRTITRGTATVDMMGPVLLTNATTSVTLNESDWGKTIILTNASPISVTLPDGLPAKFYVSFIKGPGSGDITFTAETTLNTEDDNNQLLKDKAPAYFFNVGANVWWGFGRLE